jgi:phosphatidylglycerophosphate synthase
VNDTWSHAAARTLVRPLVGTWVRPNHITLIRLASGAAACVLLAVGGGMAELWSGVLWLISAFLDRADGELARVGNMQSRRGHLFDYYTDVAVNSAFFLAAGLNLRDSRLGGWAVAAGVAACLSMLACCLLAEAYESKAATGERVWEGGWGFQPDDALYLLPLFVWLHWLAPILVAAAGVTCVIALVLLGRYLHLKQRLAFQAGPRAVGLAEVGPRDARLREAGLREAGLREVGPREAAPGEARLGEVGPREAGLCPAAPRDAGHREAPPRQAVPGAAAATGEHRLAAGQALPRAHP